MIYLYKTRPVLSKPDLGRATRAARLEASPITPRSGPPSPAALTAQRNTWARKLAYLSCKRQLLSYCILHDENAMNRDREQEAVRLVSWADILQHPAFAAGVTDRQRGKPFRSAYERQTPEWQQHYEWGRQWAVLAGPKVKLRTKNGRLTLDALRATVSILPDLRG
jgi:hypothetical protein